MDTFRRMHFLNFLALDLALLETPFYPDLFKLPGSSSYNDCIKEGKL